MSSYLTSIALAAAVGLGDPGLVPPPPRALPDTQAVREVITTGRICFEDAWQASGRLRLPAFSAAMDLPKQPIPEQWHRAEAVVTAYERSRAAIMDCITAFRAASAGLVQTDNDRSAAGDALDLMVFNYEGQSPYERRIIETLTARKPKP